VAVAEKAGSRKLFVDGTLAALDVVSGPITVAPEETPLVVGNEPTGDRPWLGRILSLSIFAGVQSPETIAMRHSAGPL
jgi:hypothetical protein